jgi:phage-related minor tail protein
MAVMEIIARATDNASSVLQGIGRTGSGAAQSLSRNWGQVAIAGAAAGAAVEGLARNVAPLNKTIRDLADSTEMTENETRKLAASMVNATFPASEVVTLLEEGRKQGLKSAEQLKEFAGFWDMVGDATGESSEQLAKSGVALRALGIDTDNQAQVLSSLGFVMRESTLDVGEFLGLIGRMAPELNEMGLSLDDTTALFAALEERGISGRQAIQQLRSAIGDGTGSLEDMKKELGISEEKFGEYRKAIEDSSEAIAESAKRNEEGKTALQRMAAWIDATKLANSGLLESLSGLAPVLMILAPAIKAVTAAKVLLNAALWASPVTWIIAAIIALIAVIVLAVKNWDLIRDAAVRAWEWIKEAWEPAGAFFGRIWAVVKNDATVLWRIVSDLAVRSWDRIKAIWGGIGNWFRSVWDGVKNVFSGVWEAITGIVESAVGRIMAIVERVKGMISWLVDAAGRARDAAAGVGKRVRGFFRRGDDDDIDVMHTGGVFRAPQSGGEGVALLRDGEQVIPRGGNGGGNGGDISMRGLFDGANISMRSEDDAERLSSELYGIFRSRARAEGLA